MREISKYASMIYRCGQIYYDEYLTPYHIDCGQQFFLLRIYEKPGISPYELASMGMYDKGTCARALKKLEEEGYIERVVDTHDRRLQHLFISTKGKELIPIIQKMLDEWYEAICIDFSEEERSMAGELMRRISEHAMHAIGRR